MATILLYILVKKLGLKSPFKSLTDIATTFTLFITIYIAYQEYRPRIMITYKVENKALVLGFENVGKSHAHNVSFKFSDNLYSKIEKDKQKLNDSNKEAPRENKLLYETIEDFKNTKLELSPGQKINYTLGTHLDTSSLPSDIIIECNYDHVFPLFRPYPSSLKFNPKSFNGWYSMDKTSLEHISENIKEGFDSNLKELKSIKETIGKDFKVKETIVNKIIVKKKDNKEFVLFYKEFTADKYRKIESLELVGRISIPILDIDKGNIDIKINNTTFEYLESVFKDGLICEISIKAFNNPLFYIYNNLKWSNIKAEIKKSEENCNNYLVSLSFEEKDSKDNN